MKTSGFILVAVLTLCIGIKAATAEEKARQVLQGKITPWEAINIAQSNIEGRPIQANFEFDEGKWIYGVMILTSSGIKEVDIDPITGAIGDTETLTPEREAEEVKQQLNTELKNFNSK